MKTDKELARHKNRAWNTIRGVVADTEPDNWGPQIDIGDAEALVGYVLALEAEVDRLRYERGRVVEVDQVQFVEDTMSIVSADGHGSIYDDTDITDLIAAGSVMLKLKD